MRSITVQLSRDLRFHEKPRAYWLYKQVQDAPHAPLITGLYISMGEFPGPVPDTLSLTIEYDRPLGFIQPANSR